MPPPSTTGLTITNPLVLYRALVATQRLQPDEAQHRLAIHLQTLYHKLKDYEPAQDYRHQLDHISASFGPSQNATSPKISAEPPEIFGFLARLREQKADANSLALARRLTSHEAALQVDSPRGLLLHGEVGTGKSMLVDLLADSLPTRKKRRFHFSTFMLDAFAKLEQLRKVGGMRSSAAPGEDAQSPALLLLARDLVRDSPILFLDEFQLPDRVASKIVTNLFTSFFQLGGVLVATSNRMPEELAKASGLEFDRPMPTSQFTRVQERLFGRQRTGRSEGMFSHQSDFSVFLEVLRARCETWDMNGSKDWRRAGAADTALEKLAVENTTDNLVKDTYGFKGMSAGSVGLDDKQGQLTTAALLESDAQGQPQYYFTASKDREVAEDNQRWELLLRAAMPSEEEFFSNVQQMSWTPVALTVYGRTLTVPRTFAGVTMWTFNELCTTNLGPADYITLASNYHTFILTDVPVLTILQKNEARRFITLLDALYEARCKLLIRAQAGPDHIFFPETNGSKDATATGGPDADQDATYAETFSDIYQDQTSPFRPNVSSYEPTASTPSYAGSPLPSTGSHRDSSKRSTRSILADEDSDFGPTYGAGRSATSHGSVVEPGGYSTRGSSDGPPGAGNEIGHTPDFQRTSIFTGEDERFAYKRARSRLWEMCSARWWARQEDGWWRPLDLGSRHWEKTSTAALATDPAEADGDAVGSSVESALRHGTSPFRTSSDPPPKIAWTHAWGMTTWGRKAGVWGQGVEGLKQKKQSTEEGDATADEKDER